MSPHDPGTLTRILRDVSENKEGAEERLMAIVYDELCHMARQRVHRVRVPGGQGLTTTELVHETYLRLRKNAELRWVNREHFLGAAARAMHNVVVEILRRESRRKRGGDRKRVPLGESVGVVEPAASDSILDHVLAKLRTRQPLHAQIVALRFRAGLTMEEAALILGRSTATIERAWSSIRVWLQGELRHPGDRSARGRGLRGPPPPWRPRRPMRVWSTCGRWRPR